MKSSVRALVAAHGSMAEGLVSAVQAITGRGDALRAVSNAGLPPERVTEALERALDDTGATVVFTDLPAGSCTLAARRVQRERAGLSVVTGVNLPVLLDFVLRDVTAPDALAAVVVRAREHLRIIAPANVG